VDGGMWQILYRSGEGQMGGGGPAIATPCEGEEGGPGGEDPSGRGPTPAMARAR
jgi:hypothetical protein